jgi:hypothetical protein
MTNHDNGRDSMLQKVIDAAPSNIHTKRIRGCLFGLVHPFFLLMNRTDTMVAPAGFTTASIVGAMRSVTRQRP